jgi:hypothetical protein
MLRLFGEDEWRFLDFAECNLADYFSGSFILTCLRKESTSQDGYCCVNIQFFSAHLT